MSDNETPQIIVNASPAVDQAQSAIRTVLLVVSAVTAIATLASKRDLAGFILYVQSNEFLQVASIIVTAGTFAWSQWKARHRAKQLAAVAADPRVPDAVATLKGQP